MRSGYWHCAASWCVEGAAGRDRAAGRAAGRAAVGCGLRVLHPNRALGLTEVAGQRDGAATLDHAVIRRRASAGDHASMYWLHRRNSRYWRCSETRRAEWALANTDDGEARPKGGPRPSRAPLLDLAFLHSPGEGRVRRHPAAAHAARPLGKRPALSFLAPAECTDRTHCESRCRRNAESSRGLLHT